jgi:hypothetical protein
MTTKGLLRGEVIGVLEPAAMANSDLALRGWLELG